MSHFEHSGSEDGQLRSPGDYNLSGDEEGADTDSLDIKPPQATVHRDQNRRKSGKEKKHSKERKHRDRDRERRSNKYDERSSSGNMREQKEPPPQMLDDRRHKYFDKNFENRPRDHRHGGNYQRREHFDQQQQPQQRSDYDNYHNRQPQQQHQQQQQHKHRERDSHPQRMSDREFLQFERRKYEASAQYNSSSRQDAEAIEQDLRSRLLSKRNKHAKEYTRYDEHYEKRPPPPSAAQPHQMHSNEHRNSSHTEHREFREHKEHKERRVNVIEVIDSPEMLNEYQASKKSKKKEKLRQITPEDPEKVARRSKLLEAEREMAKRKEVAREELEARRELRRERVETTQSPKTETKSKKRHRHSPSEKERRKKLKRDQERSPQEEGEAEDLSDDQSVMSTDEDDDDSDSDSEKSNASSLEKGENEDEDDNGARDAASPISIADLSKSPRRVSHSRSRSRSRSNSAGSRRSRFASDRSQSRSRSHESGRFASKSRSRSRSASRSRSRSRSRTKSLSLSRSRSRSGTRSEERGMIKADKKDNDIDMKDASKDKKPSATDVTDSPIDDKGQKLPNFYPGIQGCRSVEEFQCLNRIEEGTYGVVYRAEDKRTNEIVALKRLKMEKEKEGFPITSLREINTLLKGQHPNIVTVREIVVGSNMDKIFIVMDYVEHDLKSLMETMKHREQSFFPGEVKCLAQQLMRAVGHLHDNWILHRDLKTSNLLLSHKGILKVGDFGLAREYGSPLKHYTSLVVTLWYRAPELLLCSKEYSTPIDMWSVGCIFAEFLQMTAMFPGKSEIDQLNRIFKELGTPNEKIWPGYKELPAVQNLLSQNSQFTEYPVSNLRKRFFKKTTELGIGLLQGLLTYDPKQRLTAEQALKHPYFKELPLPIDPSMFPTWPAKSELGARKALASSPKPPSGGSQFKQLGRDEIITTKTSNSAGGSSQIVSGSKKSSNTGFVLNAGIDQRQMAMGPGFSLKF